MVGIETGTMAKEGVVERGVGRSKERKTRRETARRGVEDIALNLKRVTDPTVLPDVGPVRKTNHTPLPDTVPIPTRKREKLNHTALLDALNVLNDPAHHGLVHHAVAYDRLGLPLPPRYLPLSRPKWTSTSKKRMTPV